MKTSIKYFVYIRKSTDDKTHQVMSLSAQTHEMRAAAKRDGDFIYEMMEESKSAKLPGRLIFNRMLDRIEQGEANGILCWDIDRLYRNPIDEGRVRWLLQRGIIACIKTPTRQFFPQDAGLLMGVEGGRATDYIIRLAKNIKFGLDEKLRRGEWPGGIKPIGYIYDHRLRNIVPDPKKSKIVRTIFEEYAEGRHGLVSASARLFELGVKSRTGKPWSKYAIWRVLSNRLYIGVMQWNGKSHEGKYKTFISPDLFEKVQQVLKNKSKPRKVRNGHNFPFCGLFHCTCGSMMSAQWAKGNGGLYRYYRCTRKSGVCSEPYTQEQSVAEQCLVAVKPFAISMEQANLLRELVDERSKTEGASLESASAKLGGQIALVQEKINKLTRGYLDERIDEDSYQSAQADLVLEKTKLKREKERLHKTRSGYWNEPAKEVINTMELAGKSQRDKSPQEISLVVHKVGTNRLLSRKTVSFSFSEDYDFVPSLLASRRIPTHNTLPSLGDEKLESPVWCMIVDYLQTHFSNKSVFNEEPESL
jgi:site-specific DNA recombinase